MRRALLVNTRKIITSLYKIRKKIKLCRLPYPYVSVFKIVTINLLRRNSFSEQQDHWSSGCYTPGIRSMLSGYIVFVFSLCVCMSVCLCVNIYFVSKISQELLYLESWNLVHVTSMTSCIVGQKIGAVGSGHLELLPFVVLAICKCQNIETMLSLLAMAGGISEHSIMKYFLRSFSPFRWFKKGSCQFLAKECA